VLTEAQVWDALGRVTDPEFPLSIVDLGMVYAVRVSNGVAAVSLTFTSIGCPAIEMILGDVDRELRGVRGLTDVELRVVWSPPWTKDRISERGRKLLAMYGVAH